MLVGARTGAWSGGLSAKSYVHQSDIALFYDAIENNGFGSHADSPSALVDLAGNANLAVPSTGEWSFDAKKIRFDYDSAAANHYALKSTDSTAVANLVQSIYSGSYTYEIGYNITDAEIAIGTGNILLASADDGDQGVFAKVPSYSRYNIFRCGTFTASDAPNYATDAASALAGLKCLSLVIDNENLQCLFYLNGAPYATYAYAGPKASLAHKRVVLGGNAWYNGYNSGLRICKAVEFHYWRVYRKVLSPAEIAANYAVDQARFGI